MGKKERNENKLHLYNILPFKKHFLIIFQKKYVIEADFYSHFMEDWIPGFGQDGDIGKCSTCTFLQPHQNDTKLQHSHHWESPEI